MYWKVNTPGLLREVTNNPGSGILRHPVAILAGLLGQVAQRAAEIDDPQLNILMLRLALYEQGNPEKHTFEEIRAAYTAQEARLPKHTNCKTVDTSDCVSRASHSS